MLAWRQRCEGWRVAEPSASAGHSWTVETGYFDHTAHPDLALRHLRFQTTAQIERIGHKGLGRMQNELEYVALIKLIEHTYHNDAEAISRFLERPHVLLNGRSPRDVMDSGSTGANEVRILLERANAGIAI